MPRTLGRERRLAALLPSPRASHEVVPAGGEVLVVPSSPVLSAVLSPAPLVLPAEGRAPRQGRGRLARVALVLALVGGVAVGCCLFEALAGLHITRWGSVEDFFGWVMGAGIAAAVAFAGFAAGLVAVFRRRGRLLPVVAVLSALAVPVLAAWIGVTAGFHVLSIGVGADVSRVSDGVLGTLLRQYVLPRAH